MDLLALPSVVRSSLVALTWYKTLNEYDWDGDLLERARFFLERSINPQLPDKQQELICGFGSVQLREWLESIFSTLPSDEQQEIVRRAKVKDKDECDGVFLELVLRKLFAGLELNVTPHPRIPGVNTRPDFLVGQGGKNCYVEAVVTGHSPFNLNSNEEKVIELLNENLSSPKFRIGVKMEGKLKTTLGKRQVVPRLLRQLLADHAFEEVQHHYNHVGMYHTPSATIECGDWRLIGWLHPAKDSDRALAPRQDIVFHPYHAQFLIGSVQSVRERIRK